MKKYPIVLAISGTDPSGGAGQQADIKAISATGGYAACAVTAVVVQNTTGVRRLPRSGADHRRPDRRGVRRHRRTGCQDRHAQLLEVIRTVRDSLTHYGARNIVLDPVMVATSGDRLIEESAVNSLMTELIPMARVITPNIPEAEILAGTKITSQRELPEIARRLSCGGRVSVMMKAGHLSDGELTDIFYNAEEDRCIELRSRRIYTRNTHGTGCTLSSALASYLAQGIPWMTPQAPRRTTSHTPSSPEPTTK